IRTLQLLEGALAAALGRALDFETRRLLLDRRTASLRESEERFRGLFYLSAIPTAWLAPSGRFLQVNAALCSLLGYAEAELLATDLHAVTPTDDRTVHQVYLDRMRMGELPTYQLEQRFLGKGGQVIWGLLNVSPVRGPEGEPQYLMAQIQNITSHHRLQERFRELQQMEALARLLSGLSAELSPEATWGERYPPASADPRPSQRRQSRRPRDGTFGGWYYKQDDRLVGPVTRRELQQRVASGRIQGTDRVWERWKKGAESFLVPSLARTACEATGRPDG